MNWFSEIKSKILKFLLILFLLINSVSIVSAQLTKTLIESNKRTGTVTLSFKDAEISDVVSAFSEALDKPFILDPRVKGKITLESPKPLLLDEAYKMFVSSLSLYGYVIVEGDSFNSVLPSIDAKTKAVEVVDGNKNKVGMITKIFRLSNQSATQIMGVIRALVPATNPITVNVASNSLIVTDSSDNIEKISKIISSIDDPKVWFSETYTAQHMMINDLAVFVDSSINGINDKLKNSLGDHFKLTIIPSPRTNSMLLKAYKKSIINLAVTTAKEFDKPTVNPSNVHVVYLKNADATKMAKTLQNLFGVKSPDNSNSINKDEAEITKNIINKTFSDSSNKYSEISIQAESNINAILVVASEPIFRQVKQVINMLDIRRAQVFLESLIVEISAERAAEFGVQFQYLNGLNSSGEQFFGGTNFSTGGDNLLSLLSNPASASSGLNIGVINGTVNVPGVGEVANLGLLIRALETQGNANIIATPTILTLDNEEAKIVIGQNVPFVTGQFTSSATGNNPFQTVERKDVGTTLTIKPLITQDDVVKLKIFQEVSRVLDSELSSEFGTVSTTKRSIESTVLVEDEQFVVLGGLIQDQDAAGKNKVPILGDIPIMGNLFRYENKTRRKTNLFVFLRPVVIRSQNDANILTLDRYRVLKNISGKNTKGNSLILPELGEISVPDIRQKDK